MIRPKLEYYLSLESELEKCSRYVQFERSNYETYSIEFLKIIMSASSEIDTIAKEFCELINPGLPQKDKPRNINQYASCILAKHQNLTLVEIIIPRYNIKVKPWSGWGERSPSWWSGYTSIKHDRTNSFEKANLFNAILALAGHLSLMLYYFSEKNGSPVNMGLFDGPKLLGVADLSGDDDWEQGGIFWSYTLP